MFGGHTSNTSNTVDTITANEMPAKHQGQGQRQRRPRHLQAVLELDQLRRRLLGADRLAQYSPRRRAGRRAGVGQRAAEEGVRLAKPDARPQLRARLGLSGPLSRKKIGILQPGSLIVAPISPNA